MIQEKKLKPFVMIRRESVLESVISDTYSFIVLGGFFWFNYKFIGGSYFVNFLIIVAALFYVFAKTATERKLMNYSGVPEEKIQKVIKILEE